MEQIITIIGSTALVMVVALLSFLSFITIKRNTAETKLRKVTKPTYMNCAYYQVGCCYDPFRKGNSPCFRSLEINPDYSVCWTDTRQVYGWQFGNKPNHLAS